VTLNTGNPAFDGTVVSFTTTCGSVTPFAQTTAGAAEATFTAPSTEDTCTITATSGGVPASTDILVTSALTVLPDKVSVNGAAPADIIPFTIFGGISPYTVTSSDPAITLSAITATATGGTFTATVPAGTLAESVTLTVRDSAGTTATATLTITAGPVLNVLPSTQTLTNPVAADTAIYTISGGSAPYSAFSSHPSLVSVAVAGTTVTATVVAVPATDTTVTITVSDNVGATKTVTLVLDVPAAVPLTVAPPTASASCGAAFSLTFFVTGGAPTYSATSSDGTLTVSAVSGSPASFTVSTLGSTCAHFAAASTPVAILVSDSAASPALVTATLTVTNP
jgi:hypothetical protein